MKDYLGRELNVGDQVVFIARGYRDFEKGVVKRFTNKMVVLELRDLHTPSYYELRELKQFPNQLIRI